MSNTPINPIMKANTKTTVLQIDKVYECEINKNTAVKILVIPPKSIVNYVITVGIQLKSSRPNTPKQNADKSIIPIDLQSVTN